MHDAFQVSDEPVVAGLQDRVESLLLYGELGGVYTHNWKALDLTLILPYYRSWKTVHRMPKWFTAHLHPRIGQRRQQWQA